MAIKLKYRIPKATEFSANDIVLNMKEGALYYKNQNNNLFKIQGDKLKTQNVDEQTPLVNAQLALIPFAISITSDDEIEQELLVALGAGTNEQLANDQSYTSPLICPYTGVVKKVSLVVLEADEEPGNITVRVRKALGSDFNLGATEDILEEKTISNCVKRTFYDFDFNKSPFLKGEPIGITFQQSTTVASGQDNIEVIGTLVLELDSLT